MTIEDINKSFDDYLAEKGFSSNSSYFENRVRNHFWRDDNQNDVLTKIVGNTQNPANIIPISLEAVQVGTMQDQRFIEYDVALGDPNDLSDIIFLKARVYDGVSFDDQVKDKSLVHHTLGPLQIDVNYKDTIQDLLESHPINTGGNYMITISHPEYLELQGQNCLIGGNFRIRGYSETTNG